MKSFPDVRQSLNCIMLNCFPQLGLRNYDYVCAKKNQPSHKSLLP